ncbi:hypothetical protein MBGDF03_00943 [Thermoplasmatales archaeon SCGC AB-540-F20]|nr:hypothetical protein MBGDF03_00943 [Thermoplasmatales archaeon SCGC AB-540-F20]
MSELIDREKLWNDVKCFVEKRLRENHTEMYTTAQKRRFWLVKTTNSFIRVKRERSKYEHEDIPKTDFIDMWNDLNNSKFIKSGYSRRDLHNGDNWHSAVSFSLIAKLDYISEVKEGRGLKYFIKKN